MLSDVLIDWLYLFMSTAILIVCLYIAHFVIYELDLAGWVSFAVSVIDDYFWTSVAAVTLMAALVYESLLR